jgi:hypothetical protein
MRHSASVAAGRADVLTCVTLIRHTTVAACRSSTPSWPCGLPSAVRAAGRGRSRSYGGKDQ